MLFSKDCNTIFSNPKRQLTELAIDLVLSRLYAFASSLITQLPAMPCALKGVVDSVKHAKNGIENILEINFIFVRRDRRLNVVGIYLNDNLSVLVFVVVSPTRFGKSFSCCVLEPSLG